MNKNLLETSVQQYLTSLLTQDIHKVALQKSPFEHIASPELAEQISSKQKCKDKLPTWFGAPNIYYPKTINIEQTSSEITANYKATLVNGDSLLDATGGLGVDTYSFSKYIPQVTHCEINIELSTIAKHNLEVLGQKNINFINADVLQYLNETKENFNWIYIDPSRRSDIKGKVFMLKDCLPNIPENLNILFKKSNNILIKTSPILDLTSGIKELSHVKEIHVIAVKNEVKELLWILSKGFDDKINVYASNYSTVDNSWDGFHFFLEEEAKQPLSFALPKKYLYEPNAAILKTSAFKTVAIQFGIEKLAQHSHLYTSKKLVENFPGRVFKVEQVVPYQKSEIRKHQFTKANVTTRNFKLTVAQLRKKHKIKDGGDRYLFFTTTHLGKTIILDCTKI